MPPTPENPTSAAPCSTRSRQRHRLRSCFFRTDSKPREICELLLPLQQAVLNLSLGETSPPFGSLDDGVRVLMLCGRDDSQIDSGPSFDQLMAQMEDDRINKRAQMYLRDLRRDAIIEYN